MAALFCTLGTTWEIPFEAITFTCFNETYDFYKDSCNYSKIENLRQKYIKEIPDQVIIFSTDQAYLSDLIKKLLDKIKIIYEGSEIIKKLEFYVLKDISDIDSYEYSSYFENMVFSVISEHKNKNPYSAIYLSVAGGRKTMSSSLQNSGFILGADCVFHIIEKNVNSSSNEKNLFINNNIIDKEKLNAIIPVDIGKYPENKLFTENEYNKYKELLEKYFSDTEIIHIDGYNFDVNIIKVKSDAEIKKYILGTYNKATTLYSNWIDTDEDVFKILYNYKKDIIYKIKNTYFGKDKLKAEKEMQFIRKLPKTDLHCHLGGSLDSEGVFNLCELMHEDVEKEIKNTDLYNKNLEDFIRLIDDKGIRNFTYPGIRKSFLILYFISLFKNDINRLEKFIYKDYHDPMKFKNIGIENYERLGDIQGSTILQSREAISFTTEYLIRKSIEQNVKHLEIRCSPINYTREGLSDKEVIECIIKKMDEYSSKISLSLIIIASRHGKMSDVYKHIELVNDIYEGKNEELKSLFMKYFKGFDLAGDENKGRPEEFRQAFLRIMHYCPNITIHAGETLSSESIWQAIYHLNAERIGHGLTLFEDESLMKKIKERRIAIEMCPSSNYQINSFYDNYLDTIDSNRDPITNNKNKSSFDGYDSTEGKDKPIEKDIKKIYPLRKYLENGLRVTINTDNPGISKTDISQEIHKAARMTESGLNLWEILKILKTGIKCAFVDSDKRKLLYELAEKDIENIISNQIIDENF